MSGSTIAHDDVFAIASEIFTALVDGEDGTLVPWLGDVPSPRAEVAAWVDVHGPWTGRASLETSAETATALARALLRLPPDAPVTDDELVDAIGEVANVVGGNVKALLPQYGTLGLPQVARALPWDAGARAVQRLPLAWRGRPLVLTVWSTNEKAQGKGAQDKGANSERAGGAARTDGLEDG